MANLQKLDRIDTVKVGDPFTFLDLPNLPDDAKVGTILSDWWATDEPARLFRITAIHPHAVETIYLGFADAPGSFNVQGTSPAS